MPLVTCCRAAVTVGGQLYSEADGSLKAAGPIASYSGTDTLGAFAAKTQGWTAGSTPFVTATRDYGGKFTIFEQFFPQGAEGTASSKQGASSCFPAIDPSPADGKPRGYVSWQGRFMEASKGGEWEGSGGRNGPGVGTGDGGGPFVVFGQPMAESLVFSPVSNFMTNTPSNSPGPNGDSTFCVSSSRA